LAFIASGDGQPRLWIRSLGSTISQPLMNTEGASTLFWSPESRAIGFFADNKLKRIDISGGSAQVLADATARGGTWNRDNVILYTRNAASALLRVAATGGDPVAVTKLERQTSHRYPQFLPDGRRFLFYAQGTADTQGVYLGSLDSTEVSKLTTSPGSGAYASPGWLLWPRGGQLAGQRIDLAMRALVGDPVVV